MDELEIQLMAVLRQRYQPAFANGTLSRSAMDQMIRNQMERSLPILRERRAETGMTGPLTEDEITAAQLQNSGNAIEKSISQMQARLDGGLDPLRQKLVESLLVGAKSKLDTVRRWQEDPSAIDEAAVGSLSEDSVLDAKKMIGLMEQSAMDRVDELVGRGFAKPGDELFEKYEAMKQATDATLTTAVDPQAWFANQQEARRLQAEFYALLKAREKEAEFGR